jgi:DNA-binding Lrp family transcriptional regulator
MKMSDITIEEKFIVEKLQEEGGKIAYKRLQELCEDEFEGVRLILKKLKEKGIVDYEGVIPGFSAEITLVKEV